MKCPLTAAAVKYGASVESVGEGGFDTFFPERCTRHTLHVFGPMIVIALGLLAARWIWS